MQLLPRDQTLPQPTTGHTQGSGLADLLLAAGLAVLVRLELRVEPLQLSSYKLQPLLHIARRLHAVLRATRVGRVSYQALHAQHKMTLSRDELSLSRVEDVDC